METAERAQIRLLLNHLGDEARRNSTHQQQAMHADHAARKVLKSGATIKKAVRISESIAQEFVKQATEKVAAYAQDSDAFAMIAIDFNILLRELKEPIDQAVEFCIKTGEDAVIANPSIIAEAEKTIQGAGNWSQTPA